MSALLEAVAPTIFNAGSTLLNNALNRSFYSRMQDKANAFAVQERMAAQDYNSPANQLRLMQEAGMNPNLLTGTSFEATSPVQNQSVAPPAGVAPQAPALDVTSARLNNANAQKSSEESVTIKSLRNGLIKTQDAIFDFTVQNTQKLGSEISKISKEIDLISENINFLKKQSSLMDAQEQNTRESTRQIQQQIGAYAKLWRAQYNEICSRIAKTDAERQYILQNKEYLIELARGVKFGNDLNTDARPFLLKGLKNQGDIGEVQIELMRTQNDYMTFHLGQDRTFDSLHRSFKLINDGIQMIKSLQDLNPAYQGYKAGLNMLGGKIGDSMNFSSPSVAPSGYGSGWNPSYSY